MIMNGLFERERNCARIVDGFWFDHRSKTTFRRQPSCNP